MDLELPIGKQLSVNQNMLPVMQYKKDKLLSTQNNHWSRFTLLKNILTFNAEKKIFTLVI